MIRLNTDPTTQAYAQRRRGESKTDRDILRCLKRHIARDIYRVLTQPRPVPTVGDLRPTRQHLGLTMQAAANHLSVSLTTISRTERGIRPNHQFAAIYRSWLSTLGVDPVWWTSI